MLFDSWYALLRILVVGTLSYIALIVILRVSGKRTLAKMNMFDFVITIALGSVFGSLLLSKNVALIDGVLAFILLATLQFIVARLSIRSQQFQELVQGSPVLLFYRGQYLQDAMRTERISKEEIRFAIRSNQVSDLNEVEAVIFETDGSFSVLSKGADERPSMGDEIRVPDQAERDPTPATA